MTTRPAIIVHGGAGALNLDGARLARYRSGLAEACRVGLAAAGAGGGGGALAAVEAAVRAMEASGAFNAGRGSCLNLEKEVECDAAIMVGSDLAVGAVGALRGFLHPITAARRVMEGTGHVLLVAEGAARFARSLGLEAMPPGPDEQQLAEWEEMRQRLGITSPGDLTSRLAELLGTATFVPPASPTPAPPPAEKLKRRQTVTPRPDGDTVGAVAIDAQGRIAAACSTGGLWLKLPGRVGDSPIPGAGLYADDTGGGASATGVGETIIKTLLSRTACDRMGAGASASTACAAAIGALTARFGVGTAGLIAIDREGRAGAAFNTGGMGRAYLDAGMDAPVVAVHRDGSFPPDAPPP